MTMGYNEADIMPVQLTMGGAIKEDLGIEGGIIVEICVEDNSGTEKTCRQLIYLSIKMTKAFLCREALEQLHIIPTTFPYTTAENAGNISTSAEPTIIN